MLGIYFDYWLDVLQKIAVIITAASVAFAAINYFYQKRKDEVTLAFQLINQYKELIKEASAILKSIEAKIPNYSLEVRTGAIPEMTLASYMSKYKKQWLLEYKFFYVDTSNEEIRARILRLLNELEVFAAIALNSGMSKKNDISIVREHFVELVEQHALLILILAPTKEAITFREIIGLYDEWKGKTYRKWEEAFKAETAKMRDVYNREKVTK